ncbi:serine/threonine-protein kinase [Streptomyces sp. MJP52]|uniref:serine/threonine-protein kinase n=1 Tax=Streptomyces sp. MJP52 TaxID=2940555 RepID=UPI002475891E|nr:serine/threonine-protein kinase [Streptomyces sp. MJP52]MDH6224980.1 hypothetical protein [Streptomyces sp. MJP52]
MTVRRTAALPQAPVPADPWPDELLADRYRLGEKIGAGGMADVYEGVDTRLRRPVAVKIFRPGPHARTEDSLAVEAVLLARLQDPGLVTVYDVGHHDERPYLVMQLVDGPTLRGLLADGTLPERRVAGLGAALARALTHVHRAGIVHRDVKPSNVLLDAAGDPHLADFGIARLVDTTRHTAPDVLTGTAAYLAPEQVEGKRIGPAADVYALGLVLLECLKGAPEYEGTFLEAAIARVHRLPEIPSWVSPELTALLRAMTALDPESRPDAEQCATALAALHLTGDPHPAPLPAPQATRRHAHRAAAPGAHAAHAAHASPHADEAAVTRTAPVGRPRHRSRRLAVGTVLAALSVALGTTVAVAPGTSGTSDDPTSTAAAPADRPSGTATPGERDGAAPDTGSRTVPASTDTRPSDQAAPPNHAQVRPHGGESRHPLPNRPRHAADNAGSDNAGSDNAGSDNAADNPGSAPDGATKPSDRKNEAAEAAKKNKPAHPQAQKGRG